MMYNNKLIVAIKSNGKVLREFKDNVYLPYGKEYSIFIKNLNSVRAVVNIKIDGQNASGSGLVVEAGTELNLERFLKQDLNKGNRFKFIERTDKIEQHRGIKIEDGLIRIEFQFAKPNQYYTSIQPWYYDEYFDSPSQVYRGGFIPPMPASPRLMFSGSSLNNARGICTSTIGTFATSNNCSSTGSLPNETGITVAGSESNQSFYNVKNIPMEPETHAIVMRLLGETTENKDIRKPVTVDYNHTCSSCGTKNKVKNKFCSECGTALEIHS